MDDQCKNTPKNRKVPVKIVQVVESLGRKRRKAKLKLTTGTMTVHDETNHSFITDQ